MTLSELKTLIQNYVENSETTFVNTLDDFIKNAEDRIFELIQLNYFRKNVTGSLTAGNTYLTTPSDYQTSFSLAVIDANGDYHYLDKKHPTFMREYSVDPTDTSENGRPLYYADFDAELSTATDNGSGLYTFLNNTGGTGIPTFEGTEKTKTFFVGEKNDVQIYVIPDVTMDINTIRVRVFDTVGGTSFSEYTNIKDAIQINDTTKYYQIKELPNGYSFRSTSY